MDESAWWGQFSVSSGQTLFWHVGGLRLWIQRGEREWRVATEREVDLATLLSRSIPDLAASEAGDEPPLVVARPEASIPPHGAFQRFAMTATTDELQVIPACADRPVVVGPRKPLRLVSKQEVTLFVSAPLWFRVAVGPRAALLMEEPIVRPSDTWLGPPGGDGELCYWSQSDAALEAGELPVLAHRVCCAVRVINRAETPLPLDRLRLPMPHLSLYAAVDGRLWTEAVVIEREVDGEMASVRLEDAPPASVRPARLLCESRQRGIRGFLTRTFGGVLRARG
jgi:hypothetical protein